MTAHAAPVLYPPPPSFPSTPSPLGPSNALLLSPKNFDNHSKGRSGSCFAKNFIPSISTGVTFVFRYIRAGEPAGMVVGIAWPEGGSCLVVVVVWEEVVEGSG